MARGVSFAVQATPADGPAWSSLAASVEGAGFEALCVSDHPGITVSPFVALAAVAPTTTSLMLGTAVVNGGVREPFDIASDVGSLALFSSGRAFLGLGAGHTPSEWAAIGRAYPSRLSRVERLAELVPLVTRLLAGEVVDYEGEHFHLSGACLEIGPIPSVPLLIGGNGQAVVRIGAQLADTVEVGGLGRTLPDGHFHEIRWSPRDIDATVSTFRAAAGSRTPTLGALVQLVDVTDDAERTATTFLARVGSRQPTETLPSVAELLDAPFVLIGTVTEIVEKLRAAEARWGFTRYTVRAPAIEAIREVIETLGDDPPA